MGWRRLCAAGMAASIFVATAGAAQAARTLQVRLVPDSDGVALLWHDVTERERA